MDVKQKQRPASEIYKDAVAGENMLDYAARKDREAKTAEMELRKAESKASIAASQSGTALNQFNLGQSKKDQRVKEIAAAIAGPDASMQSKYQGLLESKNMTPRNWHWVVQLARTNAQQASVIQQSITNMNPAEARKQQVMAEIPENIAAANSQIATAESAVKTITKATTFKDSAEIDQGVETLSGIMTSMGVGSTGR